MKNMRKALALLLSLVMVLSLAACGGNGENTAPEITGVMDQTVEAGSEFNALAGVAASDAEDGDITAKITIEATPALTFKNGKATPDKAGSYELVYSVTDKGGETVEAYATLTVTKQTGEAVVYKDFDFADQDVDARGRGYGLFGRTAFSIYIFEKRDGITLFILFLLCAGAAVPHIVSLMGWTYYPSMTGQLIGPVQIFAYLCYGGMCNLPLIIDMMEDRKWNALRSKI